MKRTILILSLAGFVAGIAGCGKEAPPPPPPAPKVEAPAPAPAPSPTQAAVSVTDINLGIYTAELDLGDCIYVTSEDCRVRYHHYHDVQLTDFVRALAARHPQPRNPIPTVTVLPLGAVTSRSSKTMSPRPRP